MKKLAVLLMVVLVFTIASQASVLAKDKITIGWVTFSLEVAYFQNSVAGARAEAEAQGVDLVVLDPRADVQRQVTQVEDLIARGVDAIVIDAIESSALIGAVDEATQRGIKVLAVDTYIDHPELVTTVSVPNLAATREFSQFIAGWIMSKYDGKANVGIMLASTEIQLERRDGFVQSMATIPDAKVVATGDGRNIYERALSEAEDMLTAHPEINVIYATGDPQLMGALAAAEAQGRKDIAFFGWDDIPDHYIPPVQDGRILGFVNQQPSVKGHIALDLAVKAIKGEEVPKSVGVPIKIVTKYNIGEYLK